MARLTRLSLFLMASIALIGWSPRTASATSINLLTGVDLANAVLADGASDPFWDISTDGGATFVDARVAFPSILCCQMETVGAQAKWISDPSIDPGSGATGWGSNIVMVRRTFDLTGFDLPTTGLSGLWRVADIRLGVFLNGNLIDAATADGGAGWPADQAFALGAGSGLFLPGINTLELRGTSLNSAWDGFWLDATVSDEQTPVPEPGSLLLLGVGLAGLRTRKRTH